MGQAQPPISPTTQQLTLTVPVTTDVFGAGSWVFSTPPAGVTWTGTLTVSGGLNNATFDVLIGGALWGSFSGGAVFGPVQVRGQGSQQLVVNGSGLAANTLYTMTLIGSSDSDLNVQPIYPEPAASTTNVIQSNTVSGFTVDTATVGTIADRLPAMALYDEVLISAGEVLDRTYASFDVVLIDRLVDAQMRQWLVTINGQSVLTPYSLGSTALSSLVVGYPKWSASFATDTQNITAAGVQLVAGPPVLNNQIQVRTYAYTSNQTQPVTNVLGSTFGVSSYGGTQKFASIGTVANVSKNGPTLPTWAVGGAWCIRLHSVAWENLGTSVLKVYADGNVIFAVSATTNSQPQTFVFDGLLCGTSSASALSQIPITFATSTTIPAFGMYFVYDIVPIPAVAYPH